MAALNAEIPDELKRKLEIECAHRNVSIKGAIAEAISRWLGVGDKPPSEPDQDVERLLELKRIGSQEDIEAIKQNIRVFWRDARRTLASRKRKEA